jgi:hypothetical protein
LSSQPRARSVSSLIEDSPFRQNRRNEGIREIRCPDDDVLGREKP